jgi:hypothetical protein
MSIFGVVMLTRFFVDAGQEKLPLQDGWKRQTEVITSADVGAMVKKIAAVTA